jgi:hypothetical protein
MRKSIIISACGLFLLTTVLISSCKKDSSDPAKPTVTLSDDSIKVTSGDSIRVTIDATAEAGLSSIKVTKYRNNVVDASYGTSGVLTVEVPAANASFSYVFRYKTDTTDVDQLIYFTVKATATNNDFEEKDIAVGVTMSPRDNLTRKLWKNFAVIRVLTGDDISEPKDLDDVMTLNADSTWSMDWGTVLSDWGLEAFQTCQTYSVSADNKFFTRRYSDGLGNDNRVDVMDIKKLTVTEFDIQINHLDMTYFNSVEPVPDVLWTADESFIYKWSAQPR